MNDTARRIMRDRMNRRRDPDYRRDGREGRGEYEGNFRDTYERDHGGRDYEDRMDHRDRADYRRDGQDRRDYGEGYDDRRDHRDYGEDYGYHRNRYGEFSDRRSRDYADSKVRLGHKELEEWSDMLVNADGTNGARFTKKKMEEVARSIGVKYDSYTPEEFALVANMLYSDYCKALKGFVPTEIEKEAMAYGKIARAWLEDEDAPEGSEKLALYYYCIIDSDD